MLITLLIVVALLTAGALALSVASRRPPELGLTADERLQPCPEAPNCVSSDHDIHQATHHVEPLRLTVPAETAWPAVLAVLRALPRSEVLTVSEDYVHVACRSRVFRFVDDLELHLRPEEQIIALRSASRVGYSDLGVNRARVEDLRQELAAHGLVEPD